MHNNKITFAWIYPDSVEGGWNLLFNFRLWEHVYMKCWLRACCKNLTSFVLAQKWTRFSLGRRGGMKYLYKHVMWFISEKYFWRKAFYLEIYFRE